MRLFILLLGSPNATTNLPCHVLNLLPRQIACLPPCPAKTFNTYLRGANQSTSAAFGIITNTRNANNAPGIGAGEPFNVQLAAKILF